MNENRESAEQVKIRKAVNEMLEIGDPDDDGEALFIFEMESPGEDGECLTALVIAMSLEECQAILKEEIVGYEDGAARVWLVNGIRPLQDCPAIILISRKVKKVAVV